jgi:uncharacterized MnhB-related membrane protein
MTGVIDEIFATFRERGDEAYLGEPVSQTEHALQTAFAAERDGADPLLVASALVVITHRNPVTSAVALAFNLVAIAGLYMVLDAQFIGLLQVIVYAGAIMVLILFVIMLLNLREEAKAHPAGTFQTFGRLDGDPDGDLGRIDLGHEHVPLLWLCVYWRA